MLDIVSLTACLSGILSRREIRYFHDFIVSFYLTYHTTTTRSLSRYSNYSLRSLFRFLSGSYDWIAIRVRLFGNFCFSPSVRYILAADETVEGKSRSKTFGISRFYSSTAGVTVSGICWFGMTLIEVDSATSYFLGTEQIVYSLEDKARIKVLKSKQEANKERIKKGEKKQGGRPIGSKNKAKEENNTISFRVFKSLFIKVLEMLLAICPSIQLQHMVLDSAYSTADYAHLLKNKGLFIVTKFKRNARLVFPYSGEQKGKKKKQYGEAVNTDKLSDEYIVKTEIKDGIEKTYYQFQAYAPYTFGLQLLNIVVIQAKRLSDGKVSKAILVSNDLKLSSEQLTTYYQLRFQIEFDFRDAKQHFGLSDCKNYKQQNLTNFVNLSFTLCLVSKINLKTYRQELNAPKLSIIDLKMLFRARNELKNFIKLVPNQPNTILFKQLCDNYIPNDLINAA